MARSGGSGGNGASVAVLGPGGVGGLLAGLLARQGEQVLCLAGEDTASHLNQEGLAVRSGQFGNFQVPVRAAPELAEPVGACLVTVKATSLDQALRRLPPSALGPGLVVPFLNGTEHVDLLRATYPPGQVLPATIRVESTRVGPGEIHHESPFAAVQLASSEQPQAVALAGALQRAGVEVAWRDDEVAMLWDKLGFLAPLALLTTEAGAPVGVVRSERRDQLLAVVEEVAAVARSAGVEVDAGAVVGLLDRVPGTMRSSMQRDAEAGRSVEVEGIGGAVLRAAAAAGVPVPATTRVVERLRERFGDR
ncbi:MAG TPA: 2-dehydropantoate 2-reductase [Acidimicrobiales bacterium]|nr:2-dehydropantoate 2-reductase [Acidimicrobiales bacterium]